MSSSAMRRLVVSRRLFSSPTLARVPSAKSHFRPASIPHTRFVATAALTIPKTQKRTYSSTTITETERPVNVSIFEPLDTFQRRHIGPNVAETNKMLAALGYDSLDAFVRDVVPDNILSERALKVEPENGLSESQLLERLRGIANKNKMRRTYIGCGYYGAKTPAVIQRNVLESPEWYTSYTPYQPEISQGKLHPILRILSFEMLGRGTAC